MKWRLLAGGAVLVLSLIWVSTASEDYSSPGPVRLDTQGDKWAQHTLSRLTLEQKIGQMLVIWSRAQFLNVESPQYRQLRDNVRKYHLGGLGFTVPVDGGIPQKVMPYEAAALTNQLQREAELPLLFAADFEYGLTMRVNGATAFPYPMAFGAGRNLERIEAFGRIVAEEARAIGVHWNWFPTADVNSNPENPIINTRSFGEDPKQVGEMLAAYIRGAHQGGMLTTAKHFPGHGDTATDTHLGLGLVTGDVSRLEAVELPPFQAAIHAGVDAVMTAHVTVPALEPSQELVASTSRRIVTDLLQKKMGFQGLVVTDSLDMNGLMRLYANGTSNPSARAAVDAVKAGNDVILLPQDLDGAYNGLLAAVRKGEIPESRINLSVLKILRAKASLGLHKSRLVDPGRLPRVVAQPASLAVGEKAAEEALTLVRDANRLLPLARPANAARAAGTGSNGVLAVIFVDDLRGEAGRAFARELRARVPDAAIFFVDPQVAAAMTETIVSAAAQAKTIIIPVYSVPVSGKAVKVGDTIKNTVSLLEGPSDLMRRLLGSAGGRAVIVALGNPYLAADFPDVQTYLCTFSSLPVSEVSAVRALFGEAAIRGRLPVTIPNFARIGEGLDLPSGVLKDSSLSSSR